jgi:ABC-type branched-subunit amino acid transport system ATPase component
MEVRNLSAGYGRQPILFGISACFDAGRVTAIIGPNGAGKSTFLKAIFGLAKVYEGEVLIDGIPVSPNAQALVRHGVAYVPQTQNVFSNLSVEENLQIGTYVRSGGSLERVLTLFPDLKPALKKAAGKLSGGQRNMVAVGRALMSDPKVLLLDEATGGLAPLVAEDLWHHIRQLALSGVAIAAVEQNVRLALEFSDSVYVFGSGRNRLQGSPKALLARGDFEELFLEQMNVAESDG